MFKKTIAVIGGGVSGITTALTLRLLGFNATCYARELVPPELPEPSGDGNGAANSPGEDPRFASLYPAASVIPHSIRSGDRLSSLFTATQKVFNRLLDLEFPGLRTHRHFEVFEFPREIPFYVSLMRNPAELDPEDPLLPRRGSPDELHGWSFDCHFTEWPDYMTALYRSFRKAGGEIVRRDITPGDLREMEEEIVVDCTGIWSPLLFGSSPGEGLPVERGHLVVVPDAPIFRDEEGNVVSYNYTPLPSVYSDPEGQACDVYCYPRSSGWVLGGSRQQGRIDPDGTWLGPETEEAVAMNGHRIPRAILRLNGEILERSYGLQLDRYEERVARAGYRFMGTSEEGGLRLDSENRFGRKVIHNTGHGGAGVTLSWGSALAVALMTRRDPGSGYGEGLNEVCLQLIDALQRAHFT